MLAYRFIYCCFFSYLLLGLRWTIRRTQVNERTNMRRNVQSSACLRLGLSVHLEWQFRQYSHNVIQTETLTRSTINTAPTSTCINTPITSNQDGGRLPNAEYRRDWWFVKIAQLIIAGISYFESHQRVWAYTAVATAPKRRNFWLNPQPKNTAQRRSQKGCELYGTFAEGCCYTYRYSHRPILRIFECRSVRRFCNAHRLCII